MRQNRDTDVLSITLADPSRRAILERLRFGPKSVSDLVQGTGLKQPNVSNHLAKMRHQNIVRAERVGRQVFYSIAMPIADQLLHLHDVSMNPLGTPDFSSSSALNTATADIGQSGAPFRSGIETPAILSISDARTAYFGRVMNGQEDRAVAIINALLAQRTPLVELYLEVFQWAVNQVGVMYQSGLTDEAHEHMVSAITERMMTKVGQFYTPVSRSGRRAVLGSVSGNWHSLGLRMLSDGLVLLGWEALYLGANVPTQSFVTMVAATRPDLVVISNAMEDSHQELSHLVKRMIAARDTAPDLNYKIAVGGYNINVHPELMQSLHIDFTAPNLSEFLEQIQKRFQPPANR